MLPMYLYPDKILKQKCDPVIDFTDQLQEFIAELEKTLYSFNAIGLAAPQVGQPICVFTMLIDGNATTFVNPEVVEFGGDTARTEEYCLSVPGVRAVLNCRRELIHVRGRNIENKRLEMHLRDKEAMCFQHELDHLDGITMFDHMGTAQRTLKRNSYMKRLKKWKQKRRNTLRAQRKH